jgi:hypothetical protein
MDPSHAPKYTDREIEVRALQILREKYTGNIPIPIDVDQIVYKHPLIGDIVPVELLEDKFNVAALLLHRPNGKLDILVDEDTFDHQMARANFSIAHELGHVVLHEKLWNSCHEIVDSIRLHQRIKSNYDTIERTANRFASSLLMPYPTLYDYVPKLYMGLVKMYGFDLNLILPKIYAGLAKEYCVSTQPMEIRIKEAGLLKPINDALRNKLPSLDIILT